MNRQELATLSEAHLRETLRRRLPAGMPVYLFGSRARGDAAWHAVSDLGIDADIPAPAVAEILEAKRSTNPSCLSRSISSPPPVCKGVLASMSRQRP